MEKGRILEKETWILVLEVIWTCPPHSLWCRAVATIKKYMWTSGALNMITNIAPLNDEKGNCFTSKCLLLSLLIRSLPCTQIQVGKGHFFKLASLGISNSLRDAGRDSCKQHDKGAKGSLGWRILMACCLRITLSPETSLCSVYSLSTHWQQSGDFIKRVTNKVKFL